MDTALLDRKFRRMGARVKVERVSAASPFLPESPVSIDIRRDAEGEYFSLRVPVNEGPIVDAIDVQPRRRHLVLMVADPARAGDKQKFLCGHDERAWFVAAVPESAAVSTVQTAMEALRPPLVRASLVKNRVKPKDCDRRRNRGYVRQGEWFFVPAPNVAPPANLVLRDEPLRRGAGKPHRTEFLYRQGGTLVYVHPRRPNGLTAGQYRKHLQKHPEDRAGWSPMQRNPEVYVKGRVAHADHKTIVLNGWHRVVMNTETEARAMRSVAFLD